MVPKTVKVIRPFLFQSLLVAVILLNLILSSSSKAASAFLYISPSRGTYYVGDTISASVGVSSSSQAINAAQGSVSFSSSYLQYRSVSKSGSIFSFWTSGPSGNSSSVSFGGGLPSPGYKGSGRIVTITWKAKKKGTATVSVSSGKILANDGEGTNIYGGGGSAAYTIKEKGEAKAEPTPTPGPGLPYVTSPTHPDQNRWYRARDVELQWSGGKGATGYIYSFDQSAGSQPSGSASSARTTTYQNTKDGIWYFHLRAKTSSGYLSTVHYRVKIDGTPPEPFTVTVNQPGGTTNPRPQVVFEAVDKLSGIAKYEAKIDNGKAFEITSGTTLTQQRPGHHTITIIAYDQAGNTRESSATYNVEGLAPPIIIDWTHLTGLNNPVYFVGYAEINDTVYVFMDDKAIGQFLVKDKLLSKSGSTPIGKFALRDEHNWYGWQYTYQQLLMPGVHNFRFSRKDQNGAESSLTKTYPVRIEASTINIWGLIIPTSYVIYFLLLLLLLLILLLLYLYRKLRQLASQDHEKLISVTRWLKQTARFSQKIETEVEKEIPECDINQDKAKAIKKDLKDKIAQAEKDMDEEVQKPG